MALKFEYYCNKCGAKKVKRIGFICCCGGEFKLSHGWNLYDPFHPYWSENIGKKSVYLESREQRRKLMKENNLEIMPYKHIETAVPRDKQGRRMTQHEVDKMRWKNFVPGR